MSVVRLADRAPLNEYMQDAVEQLRFMLAKAEAGELKAVAIAAATSDGSVWTRMSKSESRLALLAAVTDMQYLLCKQGDDQ